MGNVCPMCGGELIRSTTTIKCKDCSYVEACGGNTEGAINNRMMR